MITNFHYQNFVLRRRDFFKNVFSEGRKCYFRDPNFKNFLGDMPPTQGARVLSLRKARKVGPFCSFAPPLKNRSLKNALHEHSIFFSSTIIQENGFH